MTVITEDVEMSIFPLREGVSEKEFRRIATAMGLKVIKTFLKINKLKF